MLRSIDGLSSFRLPESYFLRTATSFQPGFSARFVFLNEFIFPDMKDYNRLDDSLRTFENGRRFRGPCGTRSSNRNKKNRCSVLVKADIFVWDKVLRILRDALVPVNHELVIDRLRPRQGSECKTFGRFRRLYGNRFQIFHRCKYQSFLRLQMLDRLKKSLIEIVEQGVLPINLK